MEFAGNVYRLCDKGDVTYIVVKNWDGDFIGKFAKIINDVREEKDAGLIVDKMSEVERRLDDAGYMFEYFHLCTDVNL